MKGHQWLRTYSLNFNIVGDISPTQAIPLLTNLEVASAGLKSLPLMRTTADPQIHIFALASDHEYTLVRPDSSATAFCVRRPRAYYIVLGPEAIQRRILVHEYVHAMVQSAYDRLPLWMDEGLADVYCTIERMGTSLLIGRAPDDRFELLRSSGILIPVRLLFALDRRDVNTSSAPDMFYAESWLLVHMLMLQPSYAPRFLNFVEELNKGQDAEQLLSRLWGKSAGAVENELKCYLQLSPLPVERLPFASSVPKNVHPFVVPIPSGIDPLDDLLGIWPPLQ